MLYFSKSGKTKENVPKMMHVQTVTNQTEESQKIKEEHFFMDKICPFFAIFRFAIWEKYEIWKSHSESVFEKCANFCSILSNFGSFKVELQRYPQFSLKVLGFFCMACHIVL
jgi:hypothetical protein